MAAEDPVHPTGVRDLGGVGREDGEVLRRVRAAQEAAQECGKVSLVCETPPVLVLATLESSRKCAF